ncbi:hypothetical protein Vadar_026553 [Vaccinium darrowii]|uniref:Uncharacterized protein n=1 Tax=Vaccinium darrowii TaxID=229202 RepID=A0ACB7YPM6_9ERIC|nr:hypothetical protein Vadar_026553 [Vaccinium darrowii]
MGERKKEEDGKKAKIEWPPIKPKSNLKITRLKDTDLFTVQDFFTSVESKAFIKAAESIGFAHQGSLGPAKGEAYRDNDRVSLNDPVLADTIWESGLDRLFSEFKIRGKVAVGLNPNIRLYRYKVGQHFGRHIDESVDLGDGKRTHYTLLIYLSGGFKPKSKNDKSNPQDSSEFLIGGETVFYGPRNGIVAEVTPTEGMALLHIHGDKCLSRSCNLGSNFLKMSYGRSSFLCILITAVVLRIFRVAASIWLLVLASMVSIIRHYFAADPNLRPHRNSGVDCCICPDDLCISETQLICCVCSDDLHIKETQFSISLC